jgi:hypothetical protein
MINRTDMFERNVFIDSGAHGLYNEHVMKMNRNKLKHDEKYKWYWTGKEFTPEFKEYLDTYAEFIKRNHQSVDLLANVDAIFSPSLTWQSQQYFEEYHGITPVPVIHFGTPMKWLEKYLAKGYDYIALGGIGQEISQSVYARWGDQAFDRICDQPSRKPLTKVHGFAMTAVRLMKRYPWYSVDSTSWLTFGSYGQVIMPKYINGGWDYSANYQVVRVSMRPSKNLPVGSIAVSRTKKHKELFMKYIDEKGYPLGESKIVDGEEVIVEPGLVNDDKLRTELNAIYFIDFTDSLPEWPWAFHRPSQTTVTSLFK